MSEMTDPIRLSELLTDWHLVHRKHTRAEPMAKLPEEVQEFLEADGPHERLLEGADVIIVIMTQLTEDGWSPREILGAVERKLQVNVDRT